MSYVLALSLAGVVAPIIAMAVISEYLRQKRVWNQGKCVRCPTGRWTYLTDDSQGGGAYKCDECGQVIWLDWIRPRVAEPTGSQHATHP